LFFAHAGIGGKPHDMDAAACGWGNPDLNKRSRAPKCEKCIAFVKAAYKLTREASEMTSLPDEGATNHWLLELTLSGRAVVLEYCPADDTTPDNDGHYALHPAERIKARAVAWSDSKEAYELNSGVEAVGADVDEAVLRLALRVFGND
jgi:hypothetical protein